MRLKDGFITHEGAEEHITVPAGGLSFSGMVRSNKTAGFIVECLKDEVTEEEIVEKMLAKYDATKEQITKDVGDILAKLRGIGAVEE
ncbi:PqqD family protein [Jutongia sp.]|jgi:Coenzyme PQQ synthesis protein D (PqqD).|uniref:PqqD family protein n=1 Tax=Jutongia sp. TaxID=2944204 RepID=UPI0003406480|nr:coenzyme PQQ synthesis protein D (PqqD) [Clostridium sp. CAG:277]